MTSRHTIFIAGRRHLGLGLALVAVHALGLGPAAREPQDRVPLLRLSKA